MLTLSAAIPAVAVANRIGSSFPVRRTGSEAATADVVATYRAGPAQIDLAGQIVSTWAYDGEVPGRLLRARVGDVVEVNHPGSGGGSFYWFPTPAGSVCWAV